MTAAILGAGRRGKAHGAAARAVPGARVVAICDVDESRAAALAAELGGRPYTDWRRAIQDARPDFVYVTSPPPLHAEQTIVALESGAHVVLEKPIALTMAEAFAIGAAAERTGRHVQVCQQHRYGVLADRAREALAGRKVGLVHSWLYRQKPGIRGNWDRAWGGGHVVEWGIHHLDLRRYLIGGTESVSAAYGQQMLKAQPGWNNWDCYALLVPFSEGAVGTMTTTYAAWPGIPHSSGLDIAADGLLLRFRGSRLEIVTPEGAETVEETRGPTLRPSLLAALHRLRLLLPEPFHQCTSPEPYEASDLGKGHPTLHDPASQRSLLHSQKVSSFRH